MALKGVFHSICFDHIGFQEPSREEIESFVIKMAESFMKFGSPTHHIQRLLEILGKELGVEVTCIYLPAIMFLVFDKDKRKVKLIRQNFVLNLDGSLEAYKTYTCVLDKKITVKKAAKIINHLLTRPPIHSWWKRSLYNGICSFTLCATQFNGSFIDSAVAFLLGVAVTALSYAADHSPTYEDVYE